MTGYALKLVAIVSMLFDHTGDVLFPGKLWLRYIGRLAFPLYCFLLVEGFFHTRDLRKYMARLFILGIISEVPFDLAFYETLFTLRHQNVFWTLLLGLSALALMNRVRFDNIYLEIPVRAVIAVPFAVTAQLIHSDYRWVGVGLIASMYLFREFEMLRLGSGVFFLAMPFTNSIEFFGLLSYLPMHYYNGKRGSSRGRAGKILQWGMYIFYPAHLLVLAFIRDWLWIS